MATLADELLNDFEDSGSDNDDQANGFQDGQDVNGPAGGSLDSQLQNDSPEMELDGDEEAMEDAEEELTTKEAAGTETVDDEEDTKAKVEKMRLGGVRDVRSVAGLMKILQPVLQVRSALSPSPQSLVGLHKWQRSPDGSIIHRKSPTTRTFPQTRGRQRSAQSRTTPNTPC